MVIIACVTTALVSMVVDTEERKI